jgi:hypothetical protein
MNNIIGIGSISLIGIALSLFYIVLRQFVHRASERNMREEKESIERLNNLKTAFTPSLLELDKANFMSVSFINAEIKRQDTAVQAFRVGLNQRRLAAFNTKYVEYKKKIEEYTNKCLEATARVMSGYSLDASVTNKIRSDIHNLINELFKIADDIK